jgi:hypothetical protein
MSFEINRPGDSADDKPRLSAFGRRLVVAILLASLVVAALVYGTVQANRRRAELAELVLSAIERSRIVCANVLGAARAGDDAQAALQAFFRRIEAAGQVADKAAIAQEMITYCLGMVEGNAALVDELAGARNRIVLALQQHGGSR